MNDNVKPFFMKIPETIHTKLKSIASIRKTTMTAMFIEWVEGLEVDPDEV